MTKEHEIQELELFEGMAITIKIHGQDDEDATIIRVPGGWYFNNGSDEESIFIPYLELFNESKP